MGKKYIDNKRFEELIFLYTEYKGTDKNPYEEELVNTLTLLINTIIASFNFRVDTEDAAQDCFVLLIRKLKNFTPKSGAAFNYFTTMIVNNLRLIYTKDKRYTLKLQSLFELKKDTLE